MKDKQVWIAALILAVGIACAGWGIGGGIHHFAMKDRCVTVKGLSTRDVVSDHVVWPLSFTYSGQNLQSLYAEVSRSQEHIVKFFIKKGFSRDEIQLGNVSINDNWQSYYGQRPEYQYTMTAHIVISTDSIDLVRRNLSCVSELISDDIILESNEWGLNYQYNGLPELKPSMIEEATKNARVVAQKFADDANCRLGSIKNAYQGQFSIEEDSNCPWIKHVRVVTTIDYYLK